ncbi:DDE-type integrase/transposase/recombinase [Actinomadura sp. KC216]|uniref:DDE-type integrase/transposase/recombinase n=1 Tax=Actinomadura sp. KC216 TaxID=2530370 RepID=UPI001404D406|nr:DDE-type integrase/transposase/recombinase [Actinomadura sp. KC216]
MAPPAALGPRAAARLADRADPSRSEQIRAVHADSRGACGGRRAYGGRRVHAELAHGLGIHLGHGAVELPMRRAGLRGLPGVRRPRLKHQTPTAADLVDRDFTRSAPDQLWVTDITEHPTRKGKVYCCVVLDVYARRVVGWSIDSTQTAAPATNALGMAIQNRQPPPGTLPHSDHVVQYTPWAFTERAKASGLVASMGSIGDCYDTQSMIITVGVVPVA